MTSEDTLSLLRAGKLKGTTRLDLSCGLTEFPREVFDLADSLEVLNLAGNRLSDLPDDLPKLGKLKILFCSQNEFRHFPPVIGKCAGLGMVAFKSNRIETVPEGSLPEVLRWLILTDNRITRLPTSIGSCRPLQKLMLAGNLLEHLPDEMAACVNLELVRLAANRFRSLPDWLFSLPRLSWLAFSGNPLAGESVAKDIRSIPWSGLEIGEKLGEGASGVIHRAHWNDGGEVRPVAVKLFKGSVTSDGMPSCEKAACLAVGSHPHLIRPLGEIAGHPDATAGLVMELIGEEFTNLAAPPSLESCTRDVYPEGTRFPLEVVLRIAAGMAAAGETLHARGIMHGDLYGHNVLKNESGHPLLGDFGAASFYPGESGLPAGTLERIEVRAFGCLLEELLDRCDSGQAGNDAGEHLQTLVRHCMAGDPGSRPLFAEITETIGKLS